MDTIVKSISTEAPAQPLPVKSGDDSIGNYDNPQDIAPVSKGDGTLLKILELGENMNNLPEAEKSNITEIEGYIYDSLEKRGVAPTESNLRAEISKLKYEMGLDMNATPEAVLDRLGGVVKAWKSLSFVKDPQEKKQIFFKLANAKTSKDMNEIVFRSMENYKVWQ